MPDGNVGTLELRRPAVKPVNGVIVSLKGICCRGANKTGQPCANKTGIMLQDLLSDPTSCSIARSSILDLIRVSPFKPFRLHLADGKSLRVSHPDFAIASPELAAVA